MKIETHSGLMFDYDDPRPESVCLEDIAHALSQICRFGGHTPRFYSVAEHAILVRDLVMDAGRGDLALAALHHDSHEAYVGDVVTPLKQTLGESYGELLAPIDAAIAEVIGIDPAAFHHPAVKQADHDALVIEAFELKPSKGAGWDGIGQRTIDTVRKPLGWKPWMSPAKAEQIFLQCHSFTVAVLPG